MPIPKYMQKGSEGPHVVPFQSYLAGKFPHSGIVADGVYGDITAAVTIRLQHGGRIEKDGDCGPDTRQLMRGRGFDLEVAMMAIPGTTKFVQPDGTKIEWSPEMEKPRTEFHEGVHVRDVRFPGPFFDDGIDRGNEGIEVRDKTPEPWKRHAATDTK